MALIDCAKHYAIIGQNIFSNYHTNTCLKTIQDIIDNYGPEYPKTLLFNNGSEFSKFNQIRGTDVYSPHPLNEGAKYRDHSRHTQFPPLTGFELPNRLSLLPDFD